VVDDSAFTKANRDNWNAGSKSYQASHHAELEGDVLWGPSMPPERELKILGASVRGKDVLEIACGGGQSAVHLATMGAQVTGIDFSKAQLEHARAFARSKKARVRFLEADAQNLSMLEPASFDIAFSAYALGFVEDIRRTFRGVARVLRPGGLFAFSWMSPLYAIMEERGLGLKRSYFDRTPIVFEEKEGTEIDFHRTYGDWHKALTDAGYVVTEIVEPEPLPQENSYSDIFPLSKIRMIPGTTIWRARKPAAEDAIGSRPSARRPR
jgi:ubiquinone/menaquinone biosynthesis C-methylase UbiE